MKIKRKIKDFTKTKKMLRIILPLPFIMILLPVVMMFIKDMWWDLDFKLSFGELIKKNVKWQFLLMVAIHELIIYFLYFYYVFYKKKEKKDEKTLKKELEELKSQLETINSEIANIEDPEENKDELEIKQAEKAKIEEDIKKLKSKIAKLSKSKSIK